MSLTGRRAEIATALATVDGVQGFPYRPPVPTTGDGWPRLGTLERAEGLSFYVTWLVLVFLPQDERMASEWIDTNYEDLVDALLPVGFVDRIDPVNLGSESAPQYGLQITMRGE